MSTLKTSFRGRVPCGAALVLAALAGFSAPVAADVTVSMDRESNKLTILYNTAPLVTAELVFWRGDWSWFGVERDRALQQLPPPRHAYALTSRDTGFSVRGEYDMPSPSSVTMSFDFGESADGAHDVFGGLSFILSNDGLQADGNSAVPELLPDRSGWRWLIAPGKPPLEVKFDPPVAELHFERGSTGEIRAYFLTRNSRRDAGKVRMTITAPEAFKASPASRITPVSQTWQPFLLDPWRFPVDLSFLNAAEKPAGKRGFARARGEHLEFEDGTRVRFWGTNLSAYTIFGYRNPEQVRLQARRLSKLGFNLVRIHHHDSAWVQPNIFGTDLSRTTSIDANALERIHWWIKCLRDEGIYVWIDLEVGREYTAKDGIEAFDELSEGKPRTRLFGFTYVNPSIQQRIKEFADTYLSPVNPHTGLALKDDPAIVSILLLNENDLTYHFGNALLPDKNVPWHNAHYMREAREFARGHRLDFERTWRSWEHGPSKIFLNDLERRLHADLKAHVRGLGARVPIVGTNYWGRMGVAGLPSLSDGDIIDVHTYGVADEVRFNPRFRENLASWIASGAVAGKPVTVSEWNAEPFPVFDRFQVPLQLAATAGLQGWAGLLQYAYSQEPLTAPSSPSNWHAYNDPALLATLPAAALMYRQGHVREGETTYYLALSRADAFDRRTAPDTSRAIRTLTERGRLRIGLPAVKELPWFKPTTPPEGARVITDPAHDAVGPAAKRVCSDTGELCRDWDAGVLTVDTARTQIASGWIGGRTIGLADVSVEIATPNASVAVQSLDGGPIAKAQRVLISMSAQAVPRGGRLPFITEPVTGTLSIRAAPGLRLSRVPADGEPQVQKADYRDGRYTIRLTPENFAQWWVLE